jgi:hypothetical protein
MEQRKANALYWFILWLYSSFVASGAIYIDAHYQGLSKYCLAWAYSGTLILSVVISIAFVLLPRRHCQKELSTPESAALPDKNWKTAGIAFGLLVIYVVFGALFLRILSDQYKPTAHLFGAFSSGLLFCAVIGLVYCPFRLGDLRIPDVAWLVLIVSTCTVTMDWFIRIGAKVQDTQTELPDGAIDILFEAPLVHEFFRYVLIATVVLFISKLFERHEEIFDQIRSVSSQFDGNARVLRDAIEDHTKNINTLTDEVGASSLDFQRNLATIGKEIVSTASEMNMSAKCSMETASSLLGITADTFHINTILQKELRGPKISTSQAANLALVLRNYSRLVDSFDKKFIWSISKKIAPALEEGREIDALMVLAAFHNYLDKDLHLIDTAVVPELRTWFPHYASTVRELVSSLLSYEANGLKGAERFKFFATLPLPTGASGFFNISNSGADPMWSIDYLNQFLWKELYEAKASFLRLFLTASGKEAKSALGLYGIGSSADYNEEARDNSILCVQGGMPGRCKALAIPTSAWYQRKREHFQDESGSIRQGFPESEFSKLIELRRWVNHEEACAEEDIGFVVINSSKVPKYSTKAREVGLKYVPLIEAIEEYPRRVDGIDGSGVKERVFTSKDEFISIFGEDSMYCDIFAVWDCYDGEWKAALAVNHVRNDYETIRERIYCPSVMQDMPRQDAWMKMKVTLDHLFSAYISASPSPPSP